MKFGYRRDPPHKRTQKSSRMLLGTAPVTPPSASLEAHEYRPILDQNACGSCTGHGTAQAIFVSLSAAGAPIAFCPSPREIYGATRSLERQPNADGTLPSLEDVGAEPADVMVALARYGVRPMKAPSPEGYNSDVDETNVNAEVAIADLEEAGQKIVTGEYRVDETAPDMVAQLRAALAAGHAIGVGFFCDSAFQSWKAGDAPLDVIDLNDPSGGGHWLTCVGYMTTADGSTVLRLLNSWSASWGDGGHANVTEAWLKKAAFDLYVFKVSVTS